MLYRLVKILVSNLIIFYFKYNILTFLLATWEDSSQMSIIDSFNKQSGEREEGFTIIHFKRLLLDFIVNNNISFRAVTTLSFKKLIKYLN